MRLISSGLTMESNPPEPLSGEKVVRFGGFSRTFSGTRADLWRLALDPDNLSRPCVTDGSSGAQKYLYVMSICNLTIHVVFAGLSLTYPEFAAHAARLAIKMASVAGISHETTVAVSVPRSDR